MKQPAIADRDLVMRWYQDGYTYEEMQDMHERRFGTRPSKSSINYARKLAGVPPRIKHDDRLIPWAVEPEHRYDKNVRCLRIEARLQAGEEIGPSDFRLWRAWRQRLEAGDLVVHYDPEDGFMLVPRREGIDLGFIREPRFVESRPSYE